MEVIAKGNHIVVKVNDKKMPRQQNLWVSSGSGNFPSR
jgi:hypothetical protein